MKSKIPSREKLLGFFEGYTVDMGRKVIKFYMSCVNQMSRQALYDLYLKIKDDD